MPPKPHTYISVTRASPANNIGQCMAEFVWPCVCVCMYIFIIHIPYVFHMLYIFRILYPYPRVSTIRERGVLSELLGIIFK